MFGKERPAYNQNQATGMKVSPAVRDYLKLNPIDVTDWKFVEFSEIPRGPWSDFGENNEFVQLSKRQFSDYAETLRESFVQSLDPVITGARSSFADFQSEVEDLLWGNVQQNSEAVVNVTLAAAKQGNTQAQYAMGVICYVGKAVPLDYHAAVKWFSLAAKSGHLKAIRNLGTCYKRGYGVTIDLPKSVDYYTQAAKGGDSDAQFNLATAYLLGQGVTKNEKIGFDWLKKSADQGNTMAGVMLLQMGK